MSKLKHMAVVLTALFLILGVPALMYVDLPSLFAGAPDAVSSASFVLPDQPSGEFMVLLNTANHQDTVEQWKIFFSGGDAGVIMSDITCMVADADATGIQLAERYQARLPENQMRLRRENGLLLASKAETDLFDVIVLSREVADIYHVTTNKQREDIACIIVRGE